MGVVGADSWLLLSNLTHAFTIRRVPNLSRAVECKYEVTSSEVSATFLVDPSIATRLSQRWGFDVICYSVFQIDLYFML
ncbi:hypothetical protein V6N11_076740 [Hibiscus sabdariffa]|uniref:Uncharacterized protein n=1 Tax=Hibiscus sabdariffa TaxID=183260 RepID=A0ABR2A5P0_9ROSI